MNANAHNARSSGAWRLQNQPTVLLTFTMLAWAGNILVARAMSDHIPPVALAQMRWSLAFLIILPFTFGHLRRDWPVLRRRIAMVAVLGFLGISAYNTMVYKGLATTTAINAALLSTIFPLMIAAIGFLIYRDRLTLLQAVGMVLACVGAAVILTRGDLGVVASLTFTPGDLWVLGALVAYAGYTVFLRERPQVHPLTFLTATIFVGQLLLIPFAVAEYSAGARVSVDGATIATVLYVAIVPAILAFLCYNRAVRIIGSNRAGPYFHLIPIFVSLGAVTLLGERIAAFHVAGWVMILTGIALTQRFARS